MKRIAAVIILAVAVVTPAFAQQEPAATGVLSSLPRDLSPWSMFINADRVVQAVMVGLAFASLVTWTIWLAKGLELLAAKRKAWIANHILAESDTLQDAARR